MNQGNLDRIPEELRDRRQWVAWKDMPERGKVPMVAGPQRARWASTSDPDTWQPFDVAVQSLSWADGIGFVFCPDDPYTGIDLDEHRDPETGELDDIARSFLDQLESYAEVSPSGDGIHIIVKGKLPAAVKAGANGAKVEMYDRGRYFTMTGQRLPGYESIAERQEVVTELFKTYRLGTRQASATLTTDLQVAVRDARGGSTQYGLSGLRAECDAVRLASDGSQNNTLNEAAFAAGQLVAGGELEEAEALAALRQAAVDGNHPLPRAEATIQSGFKSGLASPRRAPRERLGQRVAPELGRRFRSLTVADLLEMPKPRKVVGEVTTGVNILVGHSGHGKTHLATRWMVCAAAGLLGAEQGRVVYIGREGLAGLGRRIAACSRGLGLRELAPIEIYPEEFNLVEDTAAILAQLAEGAAPILVVIDTLANASIGIDENSADMRGPLNAAHTIQHATGGAVLALHHTGWSGSRERGHSILRGMSDNTMLMQANEGDTCYRLSSLKPRDDGKFEPIYFRLEPDPTPTSVFDKPAVYMVEASAEDWTASSEDPIGQHLFALIDRFGDQAFARADAETALGLGKTQAAERIKRMTELGHLTTEGNGPAIKYRATSKATQWRGESPA